jgi:hypothetical protein
VVVVVPGELIKHRDGVALVVDDHSVEVHSDRTVRTNRSA